MTVTVNPEFASLNLAQCVLLMGYEWRRQTELSQAVVMEMGRTEFASALDVEKLGDHFEEGLEAALKDKPRPGRQRKLSGKQEAYLIAAACTDPPEGRARWTLRLLAGKVVELGFAESICHETVRQILKKTTSSPGNSTSGVSRR